MKISSQRPCGAKIKEKLMQLLSKFLPSGPAGQKYKKKAIRNCYQKIGERPCVAKGDGIITLKQKAMKSLSEFLQSGPTRQKLKKKS